MGALPLNRNKRFRQGYYYPKNPEKYIGGGPIIFRSGLEQKFFKFLDNNPNVTKWSSESVIVPYVGMDGKNHKYYVDNFVVIKEGEIEKKYLVEVKPHKQTSAPVKRNQKKSTLLYESLEWDKNQRKWASARKWAKDHGMEFIIITEKELG